MISLFQTIAASLATITVVAIICGATVYACTDNNAKYYKAMSECVSSGGSAVPINGTNGSSIICIRK